MRPHMSQIWDLDQDGSMNMGSGDEDELEIGQ